MENNFKEIKIPGVAMTGPETIVNLDDREPTPELQINIEQDEPNEPVVPVQTQQPQVKRPSRAQKRIRELNSRLHEKDALLEQERREKFELKKQLSEGSKTSKEGTQKALQMQVASLTSQMRTAMQAGDTDAVVTLQDAIMDAKTELKVLELQLNEVKPVEEYKPEPQRVEPNEFATAWVEDHDSQLRSDQTFARAAVSINTSLINEGFDAESEEFYSELSFRLARRFPTYFTAPTQEFVPQDESVVQYTHETPSRDVKPQPLQAARPQAPRQTVSGASRSPSASPNRQPSESRTVSLTPQELEQMDRWNLGLNRFAKRKDHIAKNKRDDGYVTIFMPTETNR